VLYVAEYPRWYDPLRLISAALYKYNFHRENLLSNEGFSLYHFGGKAYFEGGFFLIFSFSHFEGEQSGISL
jgi:hypothetical protein